MSNILPISRREFAVLKQLLTVICLGIAAPVFAAQSSGISLKAVPNQTTTFPPAVFAPTATAQISTAGMGLNSPYSSQKGTITLCGQLISYTPASGFTGMDTFNMTVTNSAGTVSSAVATVFVQYTPTVALQPDRTAKLQLPGAAGANYNIQASTDMKTWTNIGSAIAATNGLVIFTDTNISGSPSRYYRLAP